jgi:hypothetical protein
MPMATACQLCFPSSALALADAADTQLLQQQPPRALILRQGVRAGAAVDESCGLTAADRGWQSLAASQM